MLYYFIISVLFIRLLMWLYGHFKYGCYIVNIFSIKNDAWNNNQWTDDWEKPSTVLQDLYKRGPFL